MEYLWMGPLVVIALCVISGFIEAIINGVFKR